MDLDLLMRCEGFCIYWIACAYFNDNYICIQSKVGWIHSQPFSSDTFFEVHVYGEKSREEICKSWFGNFHEKAAFVTVLHEFSATVLMTGNLL